MPDEVTTTEPDPVVSEVKEPEPKSEKQELLDNMEACIKEFGGISNIPYKHPYWDWANKFRTL